VLQDGALAALGSQRLGNLNKKCVRMNHKSLSIMHGYLI
jgi:hypothetical protein